MATFVHIGDTHLRLEPGVVVRAIADPLPDPIPARACLEALDFILRDTASLPDLAAWLWPGDLFDARSTVEDRNALAARVVAMAERAPVVIVYGNHDQPGDLDILARLGAPRDHAPAWPIVVVDRPRVVRLRCATGDTAAVFALPYPTRAGLVAAGTPSDQVLAASYAALDALCAQGLADLDASGCAMQLVIGHANIAGAISSAGQPQIGQEIEVSPAMLARFAPRYVGWNHIHRAQTLACGAVVATYAGSICRQDWGEVEPKTYLTVTWDPSAGRFVCERRAVPVAPMYHVEGLLTPDGVTDVRVRRGPDGEDVAEPDSWAGCEVRVRYRFRGSDRARLDEGVIRSRFGAALRLVLDPVAIPDRTVRAPEVVSAATLTDKVHAFVQPAAGPSIDGSDLSDLSDKVALLQDVRDADGAQVFVARLTAGVAAIEAGA